jgi:hypothetical protein
MLGNFWAAEGLAAQLQGVSYLVVQLGMVSFSTLYFNLWHFFQFTDILLIIYCGSFIKENKRTVLIY